VRRVRGLGALGLADAAHGFGSVCLLEPPFKLETARKPRPAKPHADPEASGDACRPARCPLAATVLEEAARHVGGEANVVPHRLAPDRLVEVQEVAGALADPGLVELQQACGHI
jgi:hypothetical protein